MLFTRAFKERIAAGEITLTYRVWRQPRAKVGGRYNIPPFGAIEVTAVSRTHLGEVTPAEARDAGFEDVDGLRAQLKTPGDTEVYRVAFHFLGSTPVKQPQSHLLAEADLDGMATRLTRMDGDAPWTRRTLTLIGMQPGTRAGDLAPDVGQDTPVFKRNVRKLKALGLTESLEVGYRLSPRGWQVLDAVGKSGCTQP